MSSKEILDSSNEHESPEAESAPGLSHCCAALFHIEYEVFPTRALYFVSIAADDEATARQAFAEQFGEIAEIRKVTKGEGRWQSVPKS